MQPVCGLHQQDSVGCRPTAAPRSEWSTSCTLFSFFRNVTIPQEDQMLKWWSFCRDVVSDDGVRLFSCLTSVKPGSDCTPDCTAAPYALIKTSCGVLIEPPRNTISHLFHSICSSNFNPSDVLDISWVTICLLVAFYTCWLHKTCFYPAVCWICSIKICYKSAHPTVCQISALPCSCLCGRLSPWLRR